MDLIQLISGPPVLLQAATDPIDVFSSKQPAILWDAVEVNNGLILFAENQQYLMTTDSDLLTQETTKLNSISYYQYSRNVSLFRWVQLLGL